MVSARTLNSIFVAISAPLTGWLLILFSGISLTAGFTLNSMNVFASSGALLTVFGLLSLSRHTTGKKIEAPTSHAYARIGDEHPAMHSRNKNRGSALRRVKKEVNDEAATEIRGLLFTVIGTLIWAYGDFLPDLQTFRHW